MKSTKVFITPKFLVLHKAVYFANMFDPNLIWFYLSLVAVPEIAWSARVNTTASDGKVIISGDHNEVVVSTDRANKIALAKIKSSLESVKKSNAELFSQVQAIAQRLSVLESQGTNFCSRLMKKNLWYPGYNNFCVNVYDKNFFFSNFIFGQSW